MKTTDFVKKLSSQTLGESFEKQFGSKLNLAKYNREQLEDYRNKLRTMIFQQENTAGFNDLLTNEAYQKNKAMMELLNTRIKEMLGENIKALKDKMIELSEAKKGVRAPLKKIHAKGSKPDFLDLDKDGNKTEPMKSAAKEKKVKETIKKDRKELEGNAFGQAVRNAKKDGVQPGEKVKVGGKEYPVKEAMKKKCCCSTKGEEQCPVHGMKESWDDMMKAAKERRDSEGTGKFDKKKTTTGTVYTRKSSTYDNGTEDKPKQKKVKEGAKHPASCNCNECSGMYEGDVGKHNNKTTGFKALAKKAGGGEKGQKIAGAQFQKMKKAGQLESQFKHNVRFVNESIEFLLREDEEGKAKAITAAGDIVNDYTSWMQRVGQYQTKTMIELADAIKADFGAAEAETFKQAVGPALSATLETLTQQREAVSNAVAVLAGEAAPEAPMGADPMAAPMEPGMDMAGPDEMNPEMGGDEFGASDAAAGGPETAGRAMRESKEQRRARKLSEAHSIMSKLSK
jgi:hypothetical protein